MAPTSRSQKKAPARPARKNPSARKRPEVPSRDRILETAHRLFAHKGYAATSMDEIAAAAQASKSSIYWHFESKEEILLELLNQTTAAWIEEAVGIVAGAATPLAKMDAMAEATYGQLERSQETTRLILGMMTERSETHPRTRAAIQEIYNSYRETIFRELRKTFPFLPEQVVETVGVLMLAAVDGLFLQWQLDPEAVNPRQVFRQVQELAAPFLKWSGRQTEKK